MARPSPWWRPDLFAARRPALATRGRLKRAIRAHLEAAGFSEVETPALQISPGNETHVSAFSTRAIDGAGERPLYLHSSPEFACKKLLAAGAGDIFTFAQVFRNRERGRLHHPAFTMLEWYRVAGNPSPACGRRWPDEVGRSEPGVPAREAGRGGSRRADEGRSAAWTVRDLPATIAPGSPTPRQAARSSSDPASRGHLLPQAGEGVARHGLAMLMEDAAAILRLAGEIAPSGLLRHRDTVAEAAAEPEILTVVEAFRRHARLDLEAMLPDAPAARARLAQATEAGGLRVAADDTWSDLFSKLLSALVEPRLGHGRPTFLTRYPASEAALARLCPDDPRFAERFELYACGIELANAFHELADPAEQRRRFAAAEAERARIYGETYPIDEDFLDALAHMPDACGIALGFDRLVMLATGADHIEDVLWAPMA